MVYTNLGNVLANQKKFDEARPYYAKALELAPNIDETNWNWGIALAQEEKYDEAEAQLKRAVEINPNAAGAYDSLGDLYLYNRNDPETAISYYNKALALAPTYFKANYHIANALERQANEAHDRALKTRSQADAQVWLNKLNEAIEHYRTAAGADPDDRDAHYNLANCLMQLQQFDEAIWNFREAVRVDPQHLESWVNLGNAYLVTGHGLEAQNAYQHALQIKPDFEPAKRGLLAVQSKMRG
jgi:tetratricopeptide (TPR) repeat protein